jgi:hypothetical protein
MGERQYLLLGGRVVRADVARGGGRQQGQRERHSELKFSELEVAPAAAAIVRGGLSAPVAGTQNPPASASEPGTGRFSLGEGLAPGLGRGSALVVRRRHNYFLSATPLSRSERMIRAEVGGFASRRHRRFAFIEVNGNTPPRSYARRIRPPGARDQTRIRRVFMTRTLRLEGVLRQP